MSILSGTADFFGLDIGTTAIRLVQLRHSGKNMELVKYGYVPVDIKLSLSDSKVDQLKIAQIIRQLIAQVKVTPIDVAVGLPSNRVFTTVVDIDRLSPEELAKTISFQAETLIPTPVAESKIDWALLGDSPKQQGKVEVLLSSVGNDFIEARLEMLESIGLNVIAFEPDMLALARSMTAPDSTLPIMVLDIGNMTTDMVITMNGTPRLTRSIPTGSDAIVHSAMQFLNIDEQQAQQFVFKFGLDKTKLEGQIYNAILSTVELLVSDIDKSIKFFQSRYVNSRLERIIVTGSASTLAEFPLYLANKFSINVEIGNAWRNVAFPPEMQNELLSYSSNFGVAAGLAERS